MKKIYVSVAALVAMGAGVLWWVSSVSPEKYSGYANSSKTLSVVTTLFPLAEFARAVGGEYADVTLLLPPGIESHAFEPTPSDIVRINRSDIFVYTGKAMEPWAEDMRKSIHATVSIVDSSEGITLLKESEGAEHEADEDQHFDEMDPHIWLDFGNAARMVSTIEKAFIVRDPSRAEVYRKNAESYREELRALDREYRQTLASCKTRSIVYGGHYAFGYLVAAYDLEYRSAQGLAPDAEPSAKDIATLVRQVKENNIRYIFYEKLASPKIAEAIARETGATLLLLNAGHNVGKDDIARGTTFLDILRSNLSNLRIGLECR